MKKLHTVIFIIFFVVILVTVFLLGCRRKDERSIANFEASKTGMYSWDVAINKVGTIKVKCFLSPRSSGLKKRFQERIALENEAIADANKLKENASTSELRKLAEKEFQLRKEGQWPWRSADSWPNCQMVVVFPVFTEKNTKVVIVCRPDSQSLDIALTMQSNRETTFHDCLRIAREIVQDLDKTDVDWNELPTASAPLFDSEGKLSTEVLPIEFKEFFKEDVFLKQN